MSERHDQSVPPQMLAVADQVDSIAEQVRAFGDASQTWTTGSQAAAEVRQESTFVDEWSSTPVQHGLLLATTSLMMARDHLTGLAATIRSERCVFAPISLLRPI